MLDALRIKLANIGFSMEVIENIITYLTNHPEELTRIEQRQQVERGEEGCD